MAAFRFSHLVTINSKAVGADTQTRDLGDASKMQLIYNGIELENFIYGDSQRLKIRETLKISPDKNVIVTVANLIPYKGHLELIKAAALVVRKYSNTIFLLVGEDHGIRKNLEELSRKLGIVEHIIFMDQRKDIPKLMTASDISVLSSHEEGFSNVVLESMAAGLPVVATRVGGNPEAIIDGETGWLVPPKKPNELALKIVDLLNDSEKGKKWGEAGRRRVMKNYPVKKMVEEHTKLYQKNYRIKFGKRYFIRDV
jgi:glycosyltransferase involved in cell wall biosynthesis